VFVLVKTEVKEECILRPGQSYGCLLCETAMADMEKLMSQYGDGFCGNELSTAELLKCLSVGVSLQCEFITNAHAALCKHFTFFYL
jgi:hypothetical protein